MNQYSGYDLNLFKHELNINNSPNKAGPTFFCNSARPDEAK